MNLTLLAWFSIAVALVCASIIALDEVRRPQRMAVMNVVWPVTALYGSVFALCAYFYVGRAEPKAEQMPMKMGQGPQENSPPTLKQVGLAASHCGAGCALADLVAEFAVFLMGLTVAGSELYASFLWDFVLAWTAGVVVQYFTIKPMRNLSVTEGIVAAIKADTLSILAFQVGMYCWMALVFYKLFPGPHLHPTDPRYWLEMQIAMVLGYLTSAPMNWLLIRVGLKEKMG